MTAQGCRADNWSDIKAADHFDCRYVQNCRFSGKIHLGRTGKINFSENGQKIKSGCYDSMIHSCIIEDDVLIYRTRQLSNYHIESGAVIFNCGSVAVDKETFFGNGVRINVLNEAGGREIPIFCRLSAQLAYLLVFYRYIPDLVKSLEKMIEREMKKYQCRRGRIERGAALRNTNIIRNVYVGCSAEINGAGRLEEGTLASCKEDPVFVGSGVSADHFIMQHGSVLDQSSVISKCFVGQSVKITKQFSAENSLFFCNSDMKHGEACSVFAGPYTVSHHKSSLLVAGYFSFFNAGSGTNQSNHMYKTGPVHQGILERGCKTGSKNYLMWPCQAGSFTNILGKHHSHFNTENLPFSIIDENKERSFCYPGINIISAGTYRDHIKWQKRDRRKTKNKIDLIHYDLFSPYTISKMIKGAIELNRLVNGAAEKQNNLHFNGVVIRRLTAGRGITYYDMGIKIFTGSLLALHLKNIDISRNSLENFLCEHSAQNPEEEYLDICGLTAPVSAVKNIINKCISGEIPSVELLEKAFNLIYKEYDAYAWTYCMRLIEEKYQISFSQLSFNNLLEILEDWKECSCNINKSIIKDVCKESEAPFQVGYGRDGDEHEIEKDFKNVRKTSDAEALIMSINENTKNVTRMADRLIRDIKKIELK